MSKHTPGPWALSSDGAEIWPTTGDTAAVELCRVVGPWDSSSFYGEKTAIANARLIAAAPDLLRELDGVLCTAESQHDEDVGAALDLEGIRAAIAKATGGAS